MKFAAEILFNAELLDENWTFLSFPVKQMCTGLRNIQDLKLTDFFAL